MKTKTKLSLGISLLLLFVFYTYSLTFAFVKSVGPCGFCVAYADINLAVHKFFGVNMTLYNITDWAGVAAIAVAFGFAVLGLFEWIKRKSILKVDKSLLLLGAFYVFVFAVYLLFEFVVINRRPVLINGILEASYPSSTTTLALCVFPTAMLQFARIIKNQKHFDKDIQRAVKWLLRAGAELYIDSENRTKELALTVI